MISWLDRKLDSITMYRLLIYYLLVLLGTAMVAGAVGRLPFSPWAIAVGAGYLTAVCWVVNRGLAYLFRAPVSNESYLITALILSLIITPPASVHDLIFLTAAAGLAMASKYILAIRKQHIFNPAAVAVALTAAGAGQAASWWVGSQALLPAVVIAGLLVLRKIQRFGMVTAFLVVALLTTAGYDLLHQADILVGLKATLLQTALIFMGIVMLTEPLTSPVTTVGRRWYAALVGVLVLPQLHIGNVYSTPELALVVGNIFSYILTRRVRVIPRLLSLDPIAPATADLVFQPDQPLHYKPGQYMEWTLPHKNVDARGNRRYFTLASSPTEPTLRVGVKFYDKGSSYKGALGALTPGATLAAANLGGDFVLPTDSKRKLVLIAGGIGVTPYRSMIKYLIDTKQMRDVVLVYGEKDKANLAYTDVFDQAEREIGLKTLYVIGEPVTAERLSKEIPDLSERLCYISGPHPMVAAVKADLRRLGLPPSAVKVDFFPGYA